MLLRNDPIYIYISLGYGWEWRFKNGGNDLQDGGEGKDPIFILPFPALPHLSHEIVGKGRQSRNGETTKWNERTNDVCNRLLVRAILFSPAFL